MLKSSEPELGRDRPRAWRPGEGHSFPRGPICSRCGKSQRNREIIYLCVPGAIYEYPEAEAQGRINWARARTLEKIGLL